MIPVRSPDEPGASPGPGAGAAELDSYLPVPAADIIASGELTGRAGEITQTVIRLGARPCTVMFLGIADAAPAALRRAGAALARRLPAGRAVVCTAVLAEPDDSVQAFVAGLMLGSYQYTLKSTASGETGRPRSSCCWPGARTRRPWSSGPRSWPTRWRWPGISPIPRR